MPAFKGCIIHQKEHSHGIHHGVVGDEESTEVFIVPRNEFGAWLSQEKNIRKSNKVKMQETAEKGS